MPYITKEQAATILKTSTRGVERLVSRGKLSVTPEKIEGRTRLQPMYDDEQVRALAASMATSAETIATDGDEALATNQDNSDALNAEVTDDETAEPSQALQRAGNVEGIQAFALMVADALRGTQTPGNMQHGERESLADLSAKVLLTLKDAARLSSLSTAHLADALTTGKLKGKKIGKGWKIAPDELRAYVAKVLK